MTTELLDPERVLSYGRRIMERMGELPPCLLLHTADGTTYAVDVRNMWGDQPARLTCVKIVAALLGFGLQAVQFVPLVDTWVRELDKKEDGMDVHELARNLPPAEDDPRTIEALVVCSYPEGSTHGTILQQTYTRHTSLDDGTTFEWDEPVDRTDPKHEDYTFSAFWTAVQDVIDKGRAVFESQSRSESLDEYTAIGRKTALKVAREIGLRYSPVTLNR